MKLCKKITKTVAALLSVVLVSSAIFSAGASGRTPANFVQEDIAFETQYAEAIEKIYQATMNFEEVIYIDEYNISRQDFSRLRTELIGTHAELSLILDQTYCFQFGVADDVIMALFPIYAYSRDEAEKRLKDFYSEADKYLSLVDDSMDEFTKAVVLHDAIVLDAEYVITKRYEDGVEVFSNNYHQMMEKWGRCETYTEVYAYLLAQVGIRSEIVNSGEMNHEWLKVRLDGTYYHVDLTFDDPIPDRLGRVSHKYFLYSDEVFSVEDASISRRAHVDYETQTQTDKRYDNARFHHYNTRMCWLNGKLYAIDRDTGELVRYDHKTNMAVPMKTISEKWKADKGWLLLRLGGMRRFALFQHAGCGVFLQSFHRQNGEGRRQYLWQGVLQYFAQRRQALRRGCRKSQCHRQSGVSDDAGRTEAYTDRTDYHGAGTDRTRHHGACSD